MGQLRRLNRVVITNASLGNAFCPCLARLKKGDLLVTFRTGGPNGVLGAVRSGDRGLTWSEPCTIAQQPGVALDMGLGMAQLSNGMILQAYVNGNGEAYLVRSTDSGMTWTQPHKLGPENLPPGDWMYINFTYGNIREYDGRVLLPIQGYRQSDWSLLCAGYLVSTDAGDTWQDFVSVAHGLGDEPDLIRLPSGRLLCVSRDWRSLHGHSTSPLLWTYSDDDGKTWASPAPTACRWVLGSLYGHSPCLFLTQQGSLICAYRYTGELAEGLCGVSFNYGHQNGTAWSLEQHIWLGPGSPPRILSCGYPSFAYVDDTKILCVYQMSWGARGESAGVGELEGVFFEEV
jgi:hypothetical protein